MARDRLALAGRPALAQVDQCPLVRAHRPIRINRSRVSRREAKRAARRRCQVCQEDLRVQADLPARVDPEFPECLAQGCPECLGCLGCLGCPECREALVALRISHPR